MIELARREEHDHLFSPDNPWADKGYFQEKIINALAKIYNENGLFVAKLCDDHLDKSGNLLGVVRLEAGKYA